MTTKTELTKILNAAPLWVRGSIGAYFTLGILPFVITIAGHRYIPSTGWVAHTYLMSILSGFACGAFTFWMLIKASSNSSTTKSLRDYFAQAVAPVLAFKVGSTAVTIGVPMLFAMLAGSEVGHVYSVAATDGYSKRCRVTISLEHLPLLFNKLCGFPESFADGLENGQNVRVFGYGTELGVFYNRIETLDEQ